MANTTKPIFSGLMEFQMFMQYSSPYYFVHTKVVAFMKFESQFLCRVSFLLLPTIFRMKYWFMFHIIHYFPFAIVMSQWFYCSWWRDCFLSVLCTRYVKERKKKHIAEKVYFNWWKQTFAMNLMQKRNYSNQTNFKSK